jgi:hypothetical protein
VNDSGEATSYGVKGAVYMTTTNILDLDWDDLIDTMPATEEAIARARRLAFEAEEAPTRRLLRERNPNEKNDK